MFDISHIEKDSPIDTEISKTGVKIYEKWFDRDAEKYRIFIVW
jgi:hypothetical protein